MYKFHFHIVVQPYVIMMWTYLIQEYLKMLLQKLQLFWPTCFQNDLEWFFSIYWYVKIPPPQKKLWSRFFFILLYKKSLPPLPPLVMAPPVPRVLDLDKLEFLLKFQLLWLNGLWEDFFLNTNIFNNSWLYSL